MPSKDPVRRSQAARLAAAVRWQKPEVADLQRELEAGKAEDMVLQGLSLLSAADRQRVAAALLTRKDYVA